MFLLELNFLDFYLDFKIGVFNFNFLVEFLIGFLALTNCFELIYIFGFLITYDLYFGFVLFNFLFKIFAL